VSFARYFNFLLRSYLAVPARPREEVSESATKRSLTYLRIWLRLVCGDLILSMSMAVDLPRHGGHFDAVMNA